VPPLGEAEDVIGSAKGLVAVCYLRGGHFTVGEPCTSRFLKQGRVFGAPQRISRGLRSPCRV
jgi:hypothetical protein